MWKAEKVKRLLEAANIDSFFKNTVLNSYVFEPISSEGVQVMILESNLLMEKEIR